MQVFEIICPDILHICLQCKTTSATFISDAPSYFICDLHPPPHPQHTHPPPKPCRNWNTDSNINALQYVCIFQVTSRKAPACRYSNHMQMLYEKIEWCIYFFIWNIKKKLRRWNMECIAYLLWCIVWDKRSPRQLLNLLSPGLPGDHEACAVWRPVAKHVTFQFSQFFIIANAMVNIYNY